MNLYNPKLYKELIRDKLISGEPIYSKVGSKAGTTTGVEKPEEPLKQAPSNMYLSSEEEQKRVMEGKKRNTNDD